MSGRAGVLLLVGVLFPSVGLATWTDDLKFSGHLESDLRYVIEDWRGLAPDDGYALQMNRNDIRTRLELFPAERVRVVLDSRFRYYGFSEVGDMGRLHDRDEVDPYELRFDEAYLHLQGFVWSDLDLKIGRMVQTWGAVDQFNPTDNLSGRDFTDPLEYADKVPNQMIELDAYPADWLTLRLVWVPVFKPSALPRSATLGFAVEHDAQGCFSAIPAPPIARADMLELASLFGALDPCSLRFAPPGMDLLMPTASQENSQVGARAELRVWDLDLSFSYYYGRFSFPVAYTASALVSPSVEAPGALDVQYDVELLYPRMQVAGADLAYSADWLFDLGVYAEAALIFPEEVVFGLQARQGGALLAEAASVNVPADPFVKASAGLDYSVGSLFYVNVMYVHGFFDEFNDRYGVHDYLVANTDWKFFDSELLIRLSGVLSLDDGTFVTTPFVQWTAATSVELRAGVLWFQGDTDFDDPYDYGARPRFGYKANGRSVAYVKAKVYW